MIIRTAVACFTLLAPALMCSQPRTGAEAPEIRLDDTIPQTALTQGEMSELKGKAVVLEFWATWCAPCIAAIPHWNELVTEFKDSQVAFVSITDEKQATVRTFLGRRPIKGWIGFDYDRRVFDAYTVDGIPQTVLIDSSGKIAAVTRPDLVTSERIRELLAGRTVNVPEMPKEPETLRSGSDTVNKPLLDVLIQPSANPNTSLRRTPSEIVGKGLTLRWILANAYNLPPYRIECKSSLDTSRYDITIKAPKNTQLSSPFLQELVCVAFHVRVRREQRSSDSFILTAPEGKPDALVDTVSSGGGMSAGSKFIGVDMRSLARTIGDTLRQNVVDETGLPGKYDFSLNWDSKRPESILDAVRNQLGLSIEPGQRTVEFLVADRY